MVIEDFKPGRVGDVYRRLDKSGRHMPAGLTYVGSWVSADAFPKTLNVSSDCANDRAWMHGLDCYAGMRREYRCYHTRP
jgi:hypothetical protein